jgi:hypothetical protein
MRATVPRRLRKHCHLVEFIGISLSLPLDRRNAPYPFEHRIPRADEQQQWFQLRARNGSDYSFLLSSISSIGEIRQLVVGPTRVDSALWTGFNFAVFRRSEDQC